MRRLCLLLVVLALPLVVFGQGVEELRASVVKITSKAPEGQPRTGTGFVVHVDGEIVYIATASHVVEGDPKPQVAFYHDKRRPVAAEIGELEGGNDKGLGFLIVRDRAVAGKVKALAWSSQILRGGEDVLAIGFGQGSGEWGVIKGTVASASGSDIRIDGRIEEGNSGGPIIMNGSVAGMITSMSQGFGIGKSGIIVRSTLLGWDVNVSAPVAAGTPAPAPSAPPAPTNAEAGGRSRPAPPSDPGARQTRGSRPTMPAPERGPRWRSHEFPEPNGGLLVFTIMPDGNPACASYNAAGCLWGLRLAQVDWTKLKPLVCGEGHRAAWGVTGYDDPRHWCNLAKQVP